MGGKPFHHNQTGSQMALTAKQERFVAEYLKDGNATRAAKVAGYSAKTAHVVGYENLRKPEIAAKIAAAQAERTERTNIDIDYVIQRLSIEAEREGEGASHGARVSALRELRQHFLETAKPDPEDAPSLNISISTSAPVKDIRVTRPDR